MRTITTSPLHTEPVSNTDSRSRSRISIMIATFWHILRRDILVTVREFIPFLMQVLVQPFALLFVFGKVLPDVGAMQQMYPAAFFPGLVALTIFVAGLQGITV